MSGINEGIYEWNCLAYDNAYEQGWGSSNRTFIVDRTPPVIENIKFTPSMIKLDNSSETNVLVSAEVSDALSDVEHVNISFYNATALNSSYGEWYNQSMTKNGEVWIYSSTTGIFYVENEGRLNYSITAVDSAGNVNTTYGGHVTFNSTNGAEKTDVNTSVSTDEDNKTTIDFRNTTDTVLQIQTNQGVSNASSSVAVYDEDPSEAADFGILELGKYVEIEVSQDISESLSWVVIRVYYTDEELNESGIYEMNLKLYHYNESVSEWQTLDSTVNAAENYVEANVTHLSLFGLFGSGEYCGDGYCTGDEVCDICPEDCGSCFISSPGCEEDWTCSEWSECSPEGTRTRNCADLEDCGTTIDKPAETQTCVYTPPASPAPSPYCGDGTCQADESCSDCEIDCGSCPPPPPAGPVCGDGTCDNGESCGNCPEDCGACPPATTPPPTGIGAITARIAENPAIVMATIIAVIIVLLAQFVVLPKVSKG
ncbi:MAG: hypothetical protein JSV39_00360 [Candidatus Aenigmatarchaeota archaeon]|nr:MAG: hypothetical protein JSV39_00360 [Candidatus Aenigmarchaeota archaeon]